MSVLRRGSLPLWCLLLSALVAGSAVLRGVFNSSDEEPPMSIRLLFLSGFSWDELVALNDDGKLNSFAPLFRSSGTFGDIFGGYDDSELSVFASIISGKSAHRHKLYAAADEQDGTLPVTGMWERLVEHGQESAVIGFPVAPPETSKLLQFVPAWNELRDHPLAIRDPQIRRTVVWPDSVTEQSIKGFRAIFFLNQRDLSILKDAMASDMTMALLALNWKYVEKRAHMFVRFSGLKRWRSYLESSDPPIPAKYQAQLIEEYYRFMDALLSHLLTFDEPRAMYLLLSEKGNFKGCPDFPPRTKDSVNCPPIGFFYATGSYIKKGHYPQTLRPVDILPSVWFAAGLPLPSRIDGRIADLFSTYEWRGLKPEAE